MPVDLAGQLLLNFARQQLRCGHIIEDANADSWGPPPPPAEHPWGGVDVYVAETTERARKEVPAGVMDRDFMQYFVPLFADRGLTGLAKVDPNMPDSDINPEYLLDRIRVVGSPDDVAEKLRRLYHDVGGFGMPVAIGHEWEPRENWQNSLIMLINEVMPKLADLG